jgi:hypothetical protein
MRKRLSWGIMLWAAFLIMLTYDWKKIAYLPNLIKELRKLTKKSSRYTEDNDFVLVPKPKRKEF